MMKPFSPLFLLGALGALSVTASGSALAVDTSQWTCESCPFEKAETTGAVDVGLGGVSEDSAKFGDYTGLGDQGVYVIAGGEARYRNDDGLTGSVSATDLGLDVRAIDARVTQEGRYSVGLGYSELPHYLSDSGATPFIGNGGPVQTLPAGFPVASTADIPAGALGTVDIGFKRTRLDADAAWFASENWTNRIKARHEVKDGTQRIAGSFYATAAQLAAPVDQVTDQLEVSTAYAAEKWQVTLAYHASLFRNNEDSLTWANPFTPVVTGANSGQLALPPDNQFHQLLASGSYAILPQLRASADIAFGRMTQDSPYLAATQNTALAATVPALPASSLDGRVNTFNGSFRLAYSPITDLRMNASYARDDRDNQTQSLSYPAVSTDMFLDSVSRTNQPFSYTQDRYRINADYSGFSWLKASLGFDQDDRKRTLQDTEKTQEGTVWGRVASQVQDYLSLSLRLAHGERNNSGYSGASWVSPAENPYMRKYNQADRWRDTAGVRADITPIEGITIGLHYDMSDDDYRDSLVGLTDARSDSYGGDVSASLTENTQLHFFLTTERTRSNQAGSSSATKPNWWARNSDESTVFGVGVKHMMLAGKLELGADYVYSHSRSDVVVEAGPSDPAFPSATTELDSIKVYATYQVQSNVSVTGGIWHEAYRSNDWRLDGVTPTTVSNFLSLGEQAPNYDQNVVRIAMRYRF
jgi:MtrB/PioB family decaheme-associated outer membrane protein